MQHSVPLHLRRPATGMVDIVALEGHHIPGAIEVNTPVVVAVTGGRVVRLAIDEGVGDGNAVVGLGTQDNMLTTNTSSLLLLVWLSVFSGNGSGQTYSDMVDPDQIAVVQSDTITTPHVLRVDISDSNVPVIGVSKNGSGL